MDLDKWYDEAKEKRAEELKDTMEFLNKRCVNCGNEILSEADICDECRKEFDLDNYDPNDLLDDDTDIEVENEKFERRINEDS